MLDISGAYEKLSKICNCGDKNGCLNKNCSCSQQWDQMSSHLQMQRGVQKDSKDQAGASEVVDQDVEGRESDESD